jgi:hypothetical protein
MPVHSDPAVESFPVTDIDILFGSGQKYSCTLRDDLDRLTITEPMWVIDFAAPREHVEVYRAHVAMVTFRTRMQTRRVPSPGPGAPAQGAHGR